jgi:EAL domain-containing protein (putative c-di-GMP-specific phosphodiesterase class I)
MIQAVTWLIERLGLAWIAEGVETVDEWQAVRRFGPGLAQGYLFAEPLAEAALLRRLRAGLNGGRRSGDLVPA